MYIDKFFEGYTGRIVIFLIIVLILPGLLLLRLYFVQLDKGEEYRKQITIQSVRKVRESPVRGRIMSADGVVLADSIPYYDIVFHVSEMRQAGSRRDSVNYVTDNVRAASNELKRYSDDTTKSFFLLVQKNPQVSQLMYQYFRQLDNPYTNRLVDSIIDKLSRPPKPNQVLHNSVTSDKPNAVHFLDKSPEQAEAEIRSHFFRKLAYNQTESSRLLYGIPKSLKLKIQRNTQFRAFLFNQIDRQMSRDLKREKDKFGDRKFSDEKVSQKVDAFLARVRNLIKEKGAFYYFEQQAILSHIRHSPAIAYKAFSDLNIFEHATIQEVLPPLVGMEMKVSYRRTYPLGSLACHLLGYVGWKRPQSNASYVAKEAVGNAGLERKFDKYLAGDAGESVLQVDSIGYSRKVLTAGIKASNGNELVLTINTKAQAAAEKALAKVVAEQANRRGAVVILDCHTGAILAMASNPVFDLSHIDFSTLNKGKRPTAFNMACQASFNPGSIIKPLVGLAALECGAIKPNYTHKCIGHWQLSPGVPRVPRKCLGVHGEIDLVEALECSCNPFFFQIGVMTTLKNLHEMYRRAGLGQKTGIEIFEYKGRNPKRSDYPNWNAMETAYISIGQGRVELTPIQAACYTMAIANGGTRFRPHLVDRIVDTKGNIVKKFKPKVIGQLNVKPGNLDLVRQGMWQVVNAPHGSGKRAKNCVIELAGKTGSAEVKHIGRKNYKNSWFICYGPVDNPRYAACVLVEHGVWGGQTAAPIIVETFNSWLGKQPETNPEQ